MKNKFAGPCYRCKEYVEIGFGLRVQVGKDWVTVHKKPCEPVVPLYVLKNVRDWHQMFINAKMTPNLDNMKASLNSLNEIIKKFQ